MIVFFRQHAAERGHGAAHHVHRVCRGRQHFQHGFDAGRNTAQGYQLGLVRFQFGDGRQFSVHQQVRDFFEFAGVGDVQNIVTAIVQIVAGFADGTQCGVAGGDAGQRDGFFRLEGCCLFTHMNLRCDY